MARWQKAVLGILRAGTIVLLAVALVGLVLAVVLWWESLPDARDREADPAHISIQDSKDTCRVLAAVLGVTGAATAGVAGVLSLAASDLRDRWLLP